MVEYVFFMRNMSKLINNKEIIKPTNISFFKGSKIGIIGQNGAGKSTILKIMAGIDKDILGEASLVKDIKVGYLDQEPELGLNNTVWQEVSHGIQDKLDLIEEFNNISLQFGEVGDDMDKLNALMEKQANLQIEIDSTNAWMCEQELRVAMNALQCPNEDAVIKNLSGGEKRRVALCRLLIEKPEMLLLDEPTNHLDAESISWLEQYLQKYQGTIILVTHDRYFLDNVVEWILEIDRGNCVPWHTNYSEWLLKKQKKLELEEKEDSNKAKFLKYELEWINSSQKARQSKSKARISAYNDMMNSERDKVVKTIEIRIPRGPRLGNKVIEVENLSKSFGDKMLFKNLSFTISPGTIVGIVGPNGAGKSTLFSILTGKETPDAGKVAIGPTVKFSYVNQSRDHLVGDNNVWEEISQGQEEIILGDNEFKMRSRAYCAAFNFKGPDQQKLVGKLSGGERNRVHLAKMLKNAANVILLDEPSNDLDLNTIRSLEEGIMKFPGCAIVISHDRWFLNRIATHILAFHKDRDPIFYPGSFDDYQTYVTKLYGKDKYNHKNLIKS